MKSCLNSEAQSTLVGLIIKFKTNVEVSSVETSLTATEKLSTFEMIRCKFNFILPQREGDNRILFQIAGSRFQILLETIYFCKEIITIFE